MRKRKKLFIGLGILLVLLAVVAVSLLRGRGEKGTPVTLAAVKVGTVVGKVSGPGVVNPEAIVDISAHLPGEITRLAVKEGDAVTKGQLLLEIDPTKFQASVEEGQAAVAAQKSQVQLAHAQNEKAQADVKRSEDLYARKLVSDQEVHLARTTARVEESRLGAAEQAYQQSVAALQRAQDDLNKCRYTANMDGVVSRLNVEEGEMAVVGTMNNPGTVLLSIADLARMEVEAEIDETDIVDVRLGQKARVKVDAFPDTSFGATVTEIANTAVTRNRGTQEEVTNFTVKVVMVDRDPALRPGMTATLEIETAVRDNVVRIPIQAVVARDPEKEKQALEKEKKPNDKGGNTASAAETPEDEEAAESKRKEGVYVFRDGRAEFVPVESGVSDDRFIEIRTGLAAGERVVTGPYQTLRTLTSGKLLRERKPEEAAREGKPQT
ncbi:MAG TPA: efflux RND transporter periplasmic adaptor subunit [Candidatus Krumholzibacteria bacterium]|nr:efflux RND transporter periplasmic adaptor subunit [Candidatus Krumholzibacteria bacterium]